MDIARVFVDAIPYTGDPLALCETLAGMESRIELYLKAQAGPFTVEVFSPTGPLGPQGREYALELFGLLSTVAFFHENAEAAAATYTDVE